MPPASAASLTATARRLRIGLGTVIAIDVHAETELAARTGIEAAFAAVAAVEARMHPARPGSDLQRINEAVPGARIRIAVATDRLLRLARRLSELTLGIFDPCLPARPGRLRDLQLAAPDQNGPWVVCRTPVALDFGGFAKGHAIDCAVEALIAAGCGAGLVNAGGDVRVFGARTERMLLRRPDGECRALTLTDTALAVSATHARARPPGHAGYYIRGRPTALQRRFAAVLAPTAVSADALTKCLLLCPPQLARRALREFGARTVA